MLDLPLSEAERILNLPIRHLDRRRRPVMAARILALEAEIAQLAEKMGRDLLLEKLPAVDA